MAKQKKEELCLKVLDFCKTNRLLTQNDKVVVGVSGGADSLCLLHFLTQISKLLNLTLVVAHLNHQLRGTDSQADAHFVQETATNWQLSFFGDSQDVAAIAKQQKKSIEESARQIRYTFLGQVASKVGAAKIAVAHNSNDQAETILMHFLRGTGLSGLRGILPKIELASLNLTVHPSSSPFLIRPLLETSRSEIDTYCQQNNLTPRQDASNQDPAYHRNRLRHELIPYLENYNPNIQTVLQRTAKIIAADTEYLEKQLDTIWQTVVDNESSQIITFKLEPWLNLPLALKRSSLRRAVYKVARNLRDIGFEHIEKALNIVEKGSTSAQVVFPYGVILTLYYTTFTVATNTTSKDIVNLDEPQLSDTIPINLSGKTLLPNIRWQLQVTLLNYTELKMSEIWDIDRWEAYLDADRVGPQPCLRPRQPGDTFIPLGMAGHSKKIKDFMVDQKILKKYRNRIPLLVANNQILWVCGYRLSEQASLKADTQKVLHLKFTPMQSSTQVL